MEYCLACNNYGKVWYQPARIGLKQPEGYEIICSVCDGSGYFNVPKITAITPETGKVFGEGDSRKSSKQLVMNVDGTGARLESSLTTAADSESILLGDDNHQVHENLWLGSYPDKHLHPRFKYSLSTNQTADYQYTSNQLVISAPFGDIAWLPPVERIEELGKLLYDLSQNGPTLVHCAAGINRSSLICGIALLHYGFSGVEAVELIRKKRYKMCLSNHVFREWLEEQPAKA